MTLSCKSPFQKKSFAPGVYINEVAIADVEDISESTLPYMQEPVDIGIKLYLDIGRDFQPELVIAGNFKRDESGNVIGWGGAFVVQEALATLGFNGELENGNRIPFAALQSLVGKKFLRLSYVSGQKENGKLRYSDWNIIGRIEDTADELMKKFRRSLSKGFPRNYRPELLEEPVTSSAEPAF